MAARPLRVIIVEDSEEDAELIEIELRRAGYDTFALRVDTEPAFVAALREHEWDVIVSDFQMPSFDGLTAFALLRASSLDVPFIFVSGALGEERAVSAMRAGARDYLLKESMGRLPVAVARELDAAAARRERRGAQLAGQQERRRLEIAVEASGAGMFEHRIPLDDSTHISDRVGEMLGCTPSDLPIGVRLLPWVLERVHPEDMADVRAAYSAIVTGGGPERFAREIRMRHGAGHWVHVVVFAKVVARDASGDATHIGGVMLDQSQRHELQAQLQRAQKMEAVGQLAGGVAHDFNNILMIIVTSTELALRRLPAEHEVREDLRAVLRACSRAENLTRQLLATSRQQAVRPRAIDLNAVITDVESMLRRLLAADVTVATHLAPGLWPARLDPSAFEQVLLNLAINSRDAMPDGGRLTMETANVPSTAADARDYVLVTVADTGIGMPQEVQQRLFEPFFTTKEPGRGTGLGLSMCYGIVRQAEGHIDVHSEVGVGTRFEIRLPRHHDDAAAIEEGAEPISLLGTETILVAEDNEEVRRLLVRSLVMLGYRVMSAADAQEALSAATGIDDRIDLLVTDVVMPGKSGVWLAQQLVDVRPELLVLYVSGYTANASEHRLPLRPGARILYKPFSPNRLAREVRMVLDERR